MNSKTGVYDRILTVGLNHKVAALEVRERLASGPERITAALQELQDSLIAAGMEGESRCKPEAVLLSTCNRTEVYVYASDPGCAQQVITQRLSQAARLPYSILQSMLYVYRGKAAARHLMQVAAGLDSLLPGENEILGQVRDASEMAHKAGVTGPLLSALFRHAVQAGKRVRTETEIGGTGRSIANVVVELAQEILGPLPDHTALLIGAGKISAITAQALVRAGLRCVLIANRTFDHAQRMASRLGGENIARAVHFDALKENLSQADIVICSTGAPHIVLHAETVESVLAKRKGHPLLVADLAVPRDADPRIGSLPGVRLFNIDGLKNMAEKYYPLTLAARQEAEKIVEQELQTFVDWSVARQNVDIIQALYTKADSICQSQIARTVRRMGEITPQQRQALEDMSRAITKKLLHEPVVHLKEPCVSLPPDEYARLVSELFGLDNPS